MTHTNNILQAKMEKVKPQSILSTNGEEDGYDAVVVGSGYGGSVAACRMSRAGFKVCLVEKGRKWEAHDFPTDSFKMISAFRFENRDLGFSFGPKDALFQVFFFLLYTSNINIVPPPFRAFWI